MPSNKTIVSREQRQIVLHSAVIQEPEHAPLRSVLEKYETITEKILECDDSIDQRTKDIIRNAFMEIYNIARQEWESVRENTEGNTNCSLCNQPNKLIFFIRNKFNGNTLNVGSSCITHFSNLRDANTGESIAKIRSRILRSQDLINRKTDFRLEYKDLEKVLSRYRKILDRSEFLLPEPYYGVLSRYIESISNFERDYLSGKIPKSDLSKLKVILELCENYVENYVLHWLKEQDSENKLLCEIQLTTWLENQKETAIIETIRSNNSRIDISIINKIYETSFVEKQLPFLRKQLESLFLTIELYNGRIYVTLDEKKLKDLVFFCSPKVFMEQFGKQVFIPNPANIDVGYCLRNILTLDEPEITGLIEVLNTQYRGNYKFLFDDDTKQVYIIRGNRYVISNFNSITKRLLPYTIRKEFLEISKQMFFERFTGWQPLESFDEDKLYKLGLYE